MEHSENRIEAIEIMLKSLEILRLSAENNKFEIDDLIQEISQLQFEEAMERMFNDIDLNDIK